MSHVLHRTHLLLVTGVFYFVPSTRVDASRKGRFLKRKTKRSDEQRRKKLGNGDKKLNEWIEK